MAYGLVPNPLKNPVAAEQFDGHAWHLVLRVRGVCAGQSSCASMHILHVFAFI